MLVASTCSVMFFKRKQKLRTWRGLHSLPPEWLPHRATIESTDTSTNEYTSSTKNLGRNRTDLHSSVKQRSSDRCPFNVTVVDFVNTVPKFLSKATRYGCDARCKPVMYTDQVLFNGCRNYWMWTKKTLEVAFVWKMDD